MRVPAALSTAGPAPARVAGLALALLLAACAAGPAPAPPAAIQTNRVFAGMSPDAVFARTLEAVRAAGLRVAEADEARGVISATLNDFEPRGWAACETRYVRPRDDTDRIRDADPLGRSLALTAMVRDAPDGAALSLDANIVEELRNSFTNLTFTQSCRSTGALEGRILQAVSAGAGGA